MRINKLLIILLAVLVVGLVLMASNIKEHQREIVQLRQRVQNLETVVNHDVRFQVIPKESPPPTKASQI